MSFDHPGPAAPPPQHPGPGPDAVQPGPYAPSPGQPVLPGRPDWTAAPQPGPPQPRGILRSPQGLAAAATVLLSVGAVVNLVSVAGSAYSYSALQDLSEDPWSEPDSALASVDMLNGLIGAVQVMSLLATAVVFIIWFHRVRCNGDIFRPDIFTQSRGWAIGGWFIPLANFVLPYRTAKQTWWASTPLGPDGSHRTLSAAPVTTWWLVWVASAILDRIAGRLYLTSKSTEEVLNAYAFGIVSDLATIVAAVFAVVFVRKLTALQNTRAAQGPYAAAAGPAPVPSGRPVLPHS
ncbi:DUF4328 domain-containing protein [Streptomyces xanthophaeus]|uniref:DUF4328 domain-containing protein n=1 Tax=Streptomyces xanthophaeus TaxID=67385 RepID=UPI00068D00F6|nr:DUF4328 domain-containing protein [Streptomyces xanthophaeus]